MCATGWTTIPCPCPLLPPSLSDYSMGYVAGWSRGKELAELKASLNVIHSTAGEIINAIQPPQPELTRDEPSQERGRKTDLRKSRKRK